MLPTRQPSATIAAALLWLLASLVVAPPVTAAPGADAEPVARLTATQPKIVNGVLDHAAPSVGLFLNDRVACTGTLIGCRTFLTAAHCICSDNGNVPGSECQNRQDLLDPSSKEVFFQHVGFVAVESVSVHPGYVFGQGHDLAVVRLAGPVPGIRPSRINQATRPPFGTEGLLVGFGRAGGESRDSGLKRSGLVETASCKIAPGSTHVCWDFVAPVGAPGQHSSTCQGDSGGPLFVDLGQGPVVAGVTSGGNPSCLPPNSPWDADVFLGRSWIASAAGPDLHRASCGSLPYAGETGSQVLFASGALTPGDPSRQFQFPVPANTTLMVATLNGSSEVDADLRVRRGAPPTASQSDCAGISTLSLESCLLTNPSPGTWYVQASRFVGEGEFQMTVTLFRDDDAGGDPDDPPPPAGPWLASADLPGFETKVLINDSQSGNREARCIAETLCISGALEGRPEAFVKVIGPRPNGFYWAQVSRFTPSKLEIWLRRTATGEINYYRLDAVGATSDDVSGLQDREAFRP